jgi:hypothetical protein
VSLAQSCPEVQALFLYQVVAQVHHPSVQLPLFVAYFLLSILVFNFHTVLIFNLSEI